MSIPFCRLL